MTALPPSLDLSCFSADFAAARQRFLSALAELPPELVVEHDSLTHPEPGPGGQPLACDWVQLQAAADPRDWLVLISGTHGTEGAAGSAIQCDLLPLLVEPLRRHPSLGIVLIHALNPWGFAWRRRCDHQGIDINRNFINFNKGLPNNSHYAQLHRAIIADGDVPSSELLRPEVTKGQYQFSRGLFFGGQGPSWSRQLLERKCKAPQWQRARRVAVIDLHTGLGPYGYGEVINDHPANSVGFALAQSWYGDNAQSSALGESVSPPKLGLLDYFWHHLIGGRGSFVTLEFGSYPLTQLMQLLIEEQRYYNRCRERGEARDLDNDAVRALQHFFCPADNSWQHMLLLRARHVVSLALAGILE